MRGSMGVSAHGPECGLLQYRRISGKRIRRSGEDEQRYLQQTLLGRRSKRGGESGGSGVDIGIRTRVGSIVDAVVSRFGFVALHGVGAGVIHIDGTRQPTSTNTRAGEGVEWLEAVVFEPMAAQHRG